MQGFRNRCNCPEEWNFNEYDCNNEYSNNTNFDYYEERNQRKCCNNWNNNRGQNRPNNHNRCNCCICNLLRCLRGW